MALQSRGVNVKQYCPLLVVTFHFLLKNFFLNSSGLNSCSLLPDSRNDYKNMKTAVLHVSDVYVSVIGLYSRQGNYVIFAVYPTLHILLLLKNTNTNTGVKAIVLNALKQGIFANSNLHSLQYRNYQSTSIHFHPPLHIVITSI